MSENWHRIEGLRKRKDAFGIYYRDRSVFMERVNKLKKLSDEAYKKMKHEKELKEFLGLRSGAFHIGSGRHHSAIPLYEMAAGKKEILGTRMGDNLKLIIGGRIEKLKSNHKQFIIMMKILDAAGIADRITGKIDRDAVEECLRQNKIVHKG